MTARVSIGRDARETRGEKIDEDNETTALWRVSATPKKVFRPRRPRAIPTTLSRMRPRRGHGSDDSRANLARRVDILRTRHARITGTVNGISVDRVYIWTRNGNKSLTSSPTGVYQEKPLREGEE